MKKAIAVAVHASDPLSREGVWAQLRGCSEIALLAGTGGPTPDVAVVVGDQIDDRMLRDVRSSKAQGCSHAVLVAGLIDDAGLLAAVESGVSGVLRKSEATPEKLVSAVKSAASGSGQLAPDLLGRLLEQMSRLHSTALSPKGMALTGLTQREVGVLKLVAEGCGTSEIATALAYSERTVKSVLHDITTRLNLRTRSHAVAYAVRHGLA
jgi:DNA-binding NarL/FixJ family response regulator